MVKYVVADSSEVGLMVFGGIVEPFVPSFSFSSFLVIGGEFGAKLSVVGGDPGGGVPFGEKVEITK